MSTTTHDTTDTATDTTAATQPQLIRPEVRTTLVSGTATEVSVQASSHAFTIDEPESLGGTDKGANPVEHLLASLGACQVITFQVWADKLGIQLDAVDIALTGEIDLRGFFGLAEGVRPGFQSVEVSVQLSGPESAERYGQLTQAVEEHCPVLDGLGNAVPVSTSYAVV
jgi:uncharacterized OsmC-like protein